MPRNNRKLKGFSLVELIIVIVIIGVIAAIAVPRISRGAKGAQDSALKANLSAMRNSIDLYAAEHGGTFPTAAAFVAQITTYTDDSGAAVAVKDVTHIYGPYLKAVPALSVGAEKGSTTVAAIAAVGVGWVYDATAGTIFANCTDLELDDAGKKYKEY